MIKNYSLLILLFIVSFIAKAQPVLNATDFETELSMTLYNANPSGLSPGNAGANQVWDFSGLTLTTDNDTINKIPVATATNYNDFPNSSYCLKYTHNNTYVQYIFSSLSNTGLEMLGFSIYLYDKTEFLNIKYTNTQINFQFPYTYNMVINDTYQTVGQDPISFTTVYDAYGTLITPFGTYTNVIRQKTTKGTQVYYGWYQTKPFGFVMNGQFTDNGNGYIQVFKNTTGLGVNPIEPSKAMAVFPNPVHAELNIQLPAQQTLDRVDISDVTGKIVLKQDQNLNQINVSHLANGLYFIEAHSGMEKLVTKFIKN